MNNSIRFWSMMLMAGALLAAGVLMVRATNPEVVELCSHDGGDTFGPCP